MQIILIVFYITIEWLMISSYFHYVACNLNQVKKQVITYDRIKTLVKKLVLSEPKMSHAGFPRDRT